MPSKAHLPKRVKTWTPRAILPPQNDTWFLQAAMAKMVHRKGCVHNFTYQSDTSIELWKYRSNLQNCHLVNFHDHQLTKIPEMRDVWWTHPKPQKSLDEPIRWPEMDTLQGSFSPSFQSCIMNDWKATKSRGSMLLFRVNTQANLKVG